MSNLTDKPWLVPGHMYQYDIGWLVDKLLSFETELNTAIDLKTIHYADPIQWDITTQYSPNTVVVDPKTGTAYMSKVAVPAGILLSNTDYWVVIFNYQRVYDKIMSGVAFNDKDNLEASKDLLVNDLVWYGGDLYRATRAIPQGSKYIPGTNLTPTTIADCLATYHGRDRVAQVLNDTVNVSGDYTLNAGDISRTATHITDHATADYLVDADGNYTADVEGKYTATISGNREIDVDGDDSIHVDGVTSINRGGAVTGVYGSSRGVTVNGADKAIYKDTVTRTLEGKAIVSSKDIEVSAESVVLIPQSVPARRIDILNLANVANVRDFGAIGDGVADDTAAIQAAVNQTTYDTIFVPAGKYHTTKSIVCRDGIRVVGAGRNTVEFIDSFNTGTFTLANNVFFESLNFETDNNTEGFAFYGDGVFAVNINHCDNLGGYFKKSKSKFIKMIHSFHTLLLNDCIIDCGTTDGWGIDLTSDGDNTLNKDVQFRDVFIDTWYATDGGSIKCDSVYGVVLNNCIVRSHATCLLLDRRVGVGDCTCHAEYCFFDGDSSNTAIIVNGKTELHDFNSTYGVNCNITLNGIMYYWDAGARLIKILYGTNAFTFINQDIAFTNSRANGSWDLVKPASADSVNIGLLNQELPSVTNWDISYCGGVITAKNNYAKNGMYLLNSNGSLIYYGLSFKNNVPYLTISTHTNAQTNGVDVISKAYQIYGDLWLSVNHHTGNWVFLISLDGVSWVEFYSTPYSTYSPVGIGIAIDTGASDALIANVKQWHIETY